MSQRAGEMAEPEARITTVGSSAFRFRVDYEQSKKLPIGKAIHSDVVSAGGHHWRIEFFPRGQSEAEKGEYVSIFFRHMSKTRRIRAIIEAFVIGSDGNPSAPDILQRTFQTFEINGDKGRHDSWGWNRFAKGAILEKIFLAERHVTFVCAIILIDDKPAILVPPSDIGTHLGRLLDRTDGTDVSFIVGDETFHAHRAVVAARSPVFRAQLFGSMSEATMSSIRLHDITPATFKVMLGFIYMDEFPGEDESNDYSTEMLQNLVAAADLYALDRLKVICAQKLWNTVSVDTVATMLACAETYNCQELKNNCIDFFAVEANFKEAMFTDGYALLLLKFPSITAELKRRVRA
ncbi:BTB/POZ and MATH domain-containing protein 2-like [Triticum urartu]|nr:BTB/POZ and MATH domain-containing protein 2-like [Triticum urartu]